MASAISGCDLVTYVKRFQKVIAKLTDGFCAIHPDTAFELQVKASEVHICRADNRGIVIGNERFGMNKAGRDRKSVV